MILGIRQGAAENAAVVAGLLAELARRGLHYAPSIRGGRRESHSGGHSNFAGDTAFIQRCQVHKIRNVVEHLPEPERHAVRYRMRAAYQPEAVDGRLLLSGCTMNSCREIPAPLPVFQKGWRDAHPGRVAAESETAADAFQHQRHRKRIFRG